MKNKQLYTDLAKQDHDQLFEQLRQLSQFPKLLVNECLLLALLPQEFDHLIDYNI